MFSSLLHFTARVPALDIRLHVTESLSSLLVNVANCSGELVLAPHGTVMTGPHLHLLQILSSDYILK